ncbi:MAG: lipoyl(octanoyl) transferase LipB [Chlorobi bacterium]|nr:lipoyl(octanoyl) transferase LipB [Chlorobiota bacterium]
MNSEVEFRDLGRMDYSEAWDYQEKLLAEVQRRKLSPDTGRNRQNTAGYLLFVEHPHVYTIGKSGKKDNLLIPEEQLKREKIGFYHIDRGGDITYHGPGQIVGYPVFDLDILGIGVKKYIYLLEESVIRTLARLGLSAQRLDGTTGVWMHTGKNEIPQKICAIGVRVSRGVTMHGFAFNVNTDLHYFTYINPCGFTDKGVTSIAGETGREADMEAVKTILKDNILAVFGITRARESVWKNTGI